MVVGIGVNYYFQIVAESTPLDINAGILGLLCNILVFVAVSLMTRPVPATLANEYAEA